MEISNRKKTSLCFSEKEIITFAQQVTDNSKFFIPTTCYSESHTMADGVFVLIQMNTNSLHLSCWDSQLWKKWPLIIICA